MHGCVVVRIFMSAAIYVIIYSSRLFMSFEYNRKVLINESRKRKIDCVLYIVERIKCNLHNFGA